MNDEELFAMLFDWFDEEEADVDYYYNLLLDLGYDVSYDEVEKLVKLIRAIKGLDSDEPLRPVDIETL